MISSSRFNRYVSIERAANSSGKVMTLRPLPPLSAKGLPKPNDCDLAVIVL